MTTSTAETILTLLVDRENEWMSGQELALELNISRAAIWKAIGKLIADGFTIESQRGPGKGYRYVASEKMSVTGISYYLSEQTQTINLQVFDTLPSTNTYAKIGLISDTITQPSVIIANIQTKGAGHFGRSFSSPAQTGLYISFALPIEPDKPVTPHLLAIASAVAVARTIKSLLAIELDFKWLNDLYYQGKKVGGILTEAVVNIESQTYSAIVIGIGLNLTNQAADLSFITKELDISRNQIAASLIDNFFDLYAHDEDKQVLADYRAHLLDLGKQVHIKYADQDIRGLSKGIDDAGYLLVETQTGLTKLSAGETR